MLLFDFQFSLYLPHCSQNPNTIFISGATVSENESFCTLNSGESNNESDESQAKQMSGVSPAPEAADTEEADQDSMQAVPSNKIASAVTSGHNAPVASVASPKTTVASPPTSYRTPTQPSIPAASFLNCLVNNNNARSDRKDLLAKPAAASSSASKELAISGQLTNQPDELVEDQSSDPPPLPVKQRQRSEERVIQPPISPEQTPDPFPGRLAHLDPTVSSTPVATTKSKEQTSTLVTPPIPQPPKQNTATTNPVTFSPQQVKLSSPTSGFNHMCPMPYKRSVSLSSSGSPSARAVSSRSDP